ncbi:MAG: hypothetical protein EP305_01775 [Bacteroidetes bacterium]|nr:MAG: hypothetical protein EP305_01775 [Bacteroidota bacterium]
MSLIIRHLAFALMAFVFLGTSGITEFKHTCEEDGVFTSWLIKVEDHCDDHVEDLPPCCQKEEKKDDCCNDEEKVYQLAFDFFNDYHQQIVIQPVYGLTTSFIQFDIEPGVLSKHYSASTLRPPPKWSSGREILNFIQIYRI